jgi:hypothetical protein
MSGEDLARRWLDLRVPNDVAADSHVEAAVSAEQ